MSEVIYFPKMKIRTRFAPSPTGNLHIGNARTALVNWLYAKKHNGEFLLRIDDTDRERSSEHYVNNIINDLRWLKLSWDSSFKQTDRLNRYDEVIKHLIKIGRLYACYETEQELENKRELLLSRNLPPKYDRLALSLTNEQKNHYEISGRRPYYRFLVNEFEIKWNDLVQGDMNYLGSNLSDPVLVRADGFPTYMLCSVIDDIDYQITHILRGADHISNTALQIQIFEALSSNLPEFGHLSLIKIADGKISKRVGGFEVSNIRNSHIEPMSLNSFLAFAGSSIDINPKKYMSEIVDQFDIGSYTKTPTNYIPGILENLNEKLLKIYEYSDLPDHVKSLINEKFWYIIRSNINTLNDINYWINIHGAKVREVDYDVIKSAIECLPEELSKENFADWVAKIKLQTNKKGKDLFMPIRLALTAREDGPEINNLFVLFSRNQILKMLKDSISNNINYE